MRKIIHTINQKLSELCGWLLLVIMLLLTIDLVTREINRPIQGLTTMAVFVMMAVIYLGMARCEEYDEHVSIDILAVKLPPKAATIAKIITVFLEFITISFFLYEMYFNFIFSFTTKEAFADTTILLIWPSKLAILIGLIFFEIQVFINLIDIILRYKEGKYIKKTMEEAGEAQNF